MNNYTHALCDIGTIMLIFFNLIFMAITLFLIENIWLFLLSLFLMFIFVYLRKSYNHLWYEEIGRTLEDD